MRFVTIAARLIQRARHWDTNPKRKRGILACASGWCPTLPRGHLGQHVRDSNATPILAVNDHGHLIARAEILSLGIVGDWRRPARIRVNFNAPFGNVDDPVNREARFGVYLFLPALVVRERVI